MRGSSAVLLRRTAARPRLLPSLAFSSSAGSSSASSRSRASALVLRPNDRIFDSVAHSLEQTQIRHDCTRFSPFSFFFFYSFFSFLQRDGASECGRDCKCSLRDQGQRSPDSADHAACQLCCACRGEHCNTLVFPLPLISHIAFAVLDRSARWCSWRTACSSKPPREAAWELPQSAG